MLSTPFPPHAGEATHDTDLIRASQSGTSPARGPKLVDADVHNTLGDRAALLPHLPRFWQEEVRRNGIFVPGTLYTSPVGVLREDARNESGERPGSDPDFVIKHHLDRYGIDFAILTGNDLIGLSLHPDPDYANALASAYNDHLAEVWLARTPRFKGSILINHSDPAAAAREIARVAPDKRFVQVVMASGSPRLFGQRFFHPIYEAAAEFGLPVAIHPGTESAGTSGPAAASGHPTRYFEWHNILPTNYMAHLNSLVCEGVFEKFSGMRVVLIEGGIAWLPHLMWRMDKNYKALRSSVPWLRRLPSEYIREHVRLTTQPIEEPVDSSQILQVLEWIHAEETVMFSSDYPHWDFDNPQMSLPPLPKALKARVMAGTAVELYGLQMTNAE